MNYLDPVSIATNLIEFLLFYAAMDMVLPRKRPIRIVFFTIAAVLPVYYIGSYFLSVLSTVRLVFGITVIFIPVAFHYSGSLIRRIALYIGGWLMILIAEIIVGLFFDMQTTREHPVEVFSIYLCLIAMLLAVYVMIIRLFSKDYRELLRPSDRLTMFLFLFSQFIMLYGLVRIIRTDLFFDNQVKTPIHLILAALVFGGAADALLAKTLIRSARATRTEVENAILSKQVEAQQEYYSSLNQQYETVRHMRHDIANQIYTVKALLSDNKIQEAETYTKQLTEEHEQLSLCRLCENPIADSFLSARITDLKERGITVETDVNLPRVTRIDNSELITALGNLLDNAEEACRGLENPSVSLTIGITEGVLMIRTQNPAPLSTGRQIRIPELHRGVGTVILKQLADKYNGHYELKTAPEKCTASLFLRLPAPTL